jgi:hypothetical protein
VRPGGAIRGMWRILDGKDESGLFSCSELRGGSPRLSRLRTDRLAPMSKLDYLLVHMGFMGNCKLNSFNSHRVGRYLTLPVVMYTRTVYEPPTDMPEVSRERRALGKGGTRPDLLIVVTNYGRM